MVPRPVRKNLFYSRVHTFVINFTTQQKCEQRMFYILPVFTLLWLGSKIVTQQQKCVIGPFFVLAPLR